LEKTKTIDKWAYAVHDYGSRKIDGVGFSDKVEEIRKMIIGFAIPI